MGKTAVNMFGLFLVGNFTEGTLFKHKFESKSNFKLSKIYQKNKQLIQKIKNLFITFVYNLFFQFQII